MFLAEQNQAARRLVPSNIPAGLCFLEHRRGLHSGAVCASVASGGRRQDERTRGGPAVRGGSRDGAEDAGLLGASGLPATAGGRGGRNWMPRSELSIQILEQDKAETTDGSHHWAVDGFFDSTDGALFRIRVITPLAGDYKYSVTHKQGSFTKSSTGRFRSRRSSKARSHRRRSPVPVALHLAGLRDSKNGSPNWWTSI